METTRTIIDWIDRMTARYGAGVIDKETGQHLDWPEWAVKLGGERDDFAG